MAQLVSFSHERLQRFGKEAAERAKRREKFPQSAVLTCEYLGVPVGAGRFDAACAAITNASLAFEWRVKTGGFQAVWCDHMLAVAFHSRQAGTLPCRTWTLTNTLLRRSSESLLEARFLTLVVTC